MYRSFLCFILLIGVLFADEEPIETQQIENQTGCCVNDFQFQVTLLFFKPTLEQNSYAITSTNNRFGTEVFPYGKRHLVHSEYHPGYRLELLGPICDCPCNSWSLRYTNLKTHNCSSTSGPFMFDTVGYPGHGAQSPEDTTYDGTARMRQHYRYIAADASINRPLFCTYCDNLSFLFGLHYAYVQFKERFTSDGTFLSDGTKILQNDMRLKSSFWGIGPEVGIDYNYVLPNCRACGVFALNVNVRGILLTSSNLADVRDRTNRTGSVGVKVKNNSHIVRLNPACNAQLGFNYSCSACDFDTFFEIGYEFAWYSKCINKITSYDVAFAGDTLDAFEDLSLQGPFIRLNIQY